MVGARKILTIVLTTIQNWSAGAEKLSV